MENSIIYKVGKSGKILIGRVLPGHDFIQGIEDAFRESGLKSGNLVSCVGSLRQASFIYIKPKPGGLMGAGYDAPTILEGPLELLTIQGPIILDEGGEIFYHFHGTVMDRDARVWGGHFFREGTVMPDGQKLPGGNPVLATVDFTIIGHEGARIVRRLDPQLGMKALTPETE
ncbi:MAG: DNA-binding protein [Deltaproteobacteria bacterium]|nr:DNA-binding protein [Deltaproteobacteria bacterium]